MGDLWDRYKRDHLPRKAERSQADETMMWEKLVLPALGKHKVTDITGAHIHDLRHSFASLLVSGGASLPIIGAMLGHTQVQTTQRYAHLYDEPLRAAADHVGKAIDMAGKKSHPEKNGESV